MSLETEVAALVTSTTELVEAVNVKKQELDDAVEGAQQAVSNLASTADSAGASLVGYDDSTVQTVLDNAKALTDYTALRTYTGRATGVRITQSGIAGFFQRDTTDTTSIDDGGTIIVDASGRRWKRLYSGVVDVKWFGADDSLAVQRALTAGFCRFTKGTYDLGGNDIVINNSVELILDEGVVFTNGFLQLRPTDAEKRVVVRGDLNMGDQASVRIAGAYTSAETDPLVADSNSITLLCDNIRTTSKYPSATAAVLIYSIKNSNIGNIWITGSSMSDPDAVGAYIADWWDSVMNDLTVDGEFAMACEVDNNSTRPAWSMCRCSIRDVYVKKAAGFADVSGDHGFYLHGAYMTSIRAVRGTGWGAGISSSADFKFRDNVDCVVELVDVGRARFTSDNNYPFFTITSKRNLVRKLTASISVSAVVGTSGLHSGNRIGNLTTPVISFDNNNNGPRGFIFYGDCSIGGAADVVNCSSISFEDAELTVADGSYFMGTAFMMKNVNANSSLSFKPNTSSSTKFQNVKVTGNLAIEPSSTVLTHSVNYRGVYVSGEIRVKSFGGVVSNADFADVMSDSNEPSSSYRATTRKYRFVAFNDNNYPALTV